MFTLRSVRKGITAAQLSPRRRTIHQQLFTLAGVFPDGPQAASLHPILSLDTTPYGL